MPGKVVVIVEDDPMNRLLAIDALERAGYEVVDFARADDAAAHLDGDHDGIAALLTDIGMPGEQDGLDLAHAFARRWPGKPVLLTSGRFGPERPSGLPDGADFIPKPWDAKTLMQRMAEAIDRRR